MQKACSYECEVVLANLHVAKLAKQRDKEDRARTKARLIELKPRRYWIAKLKEVMHEWVRLRDYGKPCISCGRPLISTGKPGGDYDAGHYRSVGSAKHLEFDERNIHGQCKQCNQWLSGNVVAYREGLIERYGEKAVEELEADQTPRKYSIEQLRELIAKYSGRVAELKKRIVL